MSDQAPEAGTVEATEPQSPAVDFTPIDERTGSADKALGAEGQGDATWIPDEWRDEPNDGAKS